MTNMFFKSKQLGLISNWEIILLIIIISIKYYVSICSLQVSGFLLKEKTYI